MHHLLPGGFPIGCAESGQGRPLLMLHCSGADRSAWDRVIAAWAKTEEDASRRILRPEFFGCGGTGRWPGDRPASLDDMADLAARALRTVAEPVDLIGHSFGGAVALHLARRMPERFRTLTLIEPAAFFVLRDRGAEEQRLLDEIVRVARRIQAGAAMDTEHSRQDAMACFVDYWNGAGKWRALPPDARMALAKLADVISQDFDVLFTETSRLADCRALATPTLVINGLLSPAPVQHIAALLARTIPGAERFCIHDAGHMMPLTHAPLLAKLIGRFQRSEDAKPVAIWCEGRPHETRPVAQCDTAATV